MGTTRLGIWNAVVAIAGLLAAAQPGVASHQQPALATRSSGPHGEYAIFLAGRTIEPRPGIEKAASAHGPLIIQLDGPVTSSMKEDLRSSGAELLYYLPRYAFLATVSAQVIPSDLGALPHVRWIGPYLPEYKVASSVAELAQRDPAEAVVVDLMLVPEAAAQSIADALGRRFGTPFAVHVKPHRGLLRARVSPDTLVALADAAAANPEVLSVSARPLPTPANDHSVWVIQSYNRSYGPSEAAGSPPLQYPVSATVFHHGLMGEGEIVAVADSGLDPDCYFKLTSSDFPTPQELEPPATGVIEPWRKVIAYYVEPGATPYDEGCPNLDRHGTHVTGSVAGDDYHNTSSEVGDLPNHDPGDGMAPSAKIVVQDLGSSVNCSLEGLLNDLSDMVEQAYQAGVRIHSNSWIFGTPEYTTDCLDMDEITWRTEDILFTIAMGNTGGAPGDSSLGAPATAKNVIAVGGVTHGSDVTRADEMTRYSRGPASDGRIKPEVVAPAKYIYTAQGGGSCGPVPLSGTSIATPTTAGGLALIREYLRKGYHRTGTKQSVDALMPSAALVKAALINGATPLGIVSGYDPLAGGPVSPIPSMDQGWGRVYLEGSLYFAGDSDRIRYWDVRHRNGIETGEIMEWHVDVPSIVPELRVTLVWSDPPAFTGAGSALVNDLDLELISPSSTVYRGNVMSNGWSTTGGTHDQLNPVEGVRVYHPSVGQWTIRVIGANVPGTGLALHSHRQGFAVVARCATCSATTPSAPQNLTAIDQGNDGVLLSWNPVAGAQRYSVFRVEGDCGTAASMFSFFGEASTNQWIDTKAYGGYPYAYRVAAQNTCNRSPFSACAWTPATGACTLPPSFDGLEALTNTSTPQSCSLQLEWGPAEAFCPLGPELSYNVYRSTDPFFVPDPTSLLATLTDLGFEDRSVESGVPYYYVVRAEDSTTGNSGPNGGNQDGNTLRMRTLAWAGVASTVTTFTDDGGDSTAWLEGDTPWMVSAQDNHSAGGSYCYHSAAEDRYYPPDVCAALTSPPLVLAPGLPHQLTYWARYNIETDWDGVVVEISIDQGATWSDLPPTVGYPGSFANTGDPPGNVCEYPATHGAFNGPGDNSELTEWTLYTSNLSLYDGATVLIRWQLSTDPGLEYEGFFLDDISVSNVYGPGLCETCTAPLFAGLATAAPVSGQPAADLTWPAAIDDCATGFLEYLVYVGVNTAVNWQTPIASTTGTSLRVRGLAPGQSYWFGVRARDGNGGMDDNTIEIGPIVAQGDRPDGDADCSGVITTADIVAIVDHLFGAAAGPCGGEDANRDLAVNAADVAQVVRYLHDGL